MLKFTLFALVILALTSLVSAAFHPQMSLEAHKARRLDSLARDIQTGKIHPKLQDLFPSTVSSFNVTAFLGRWYNVYANNLVLDTFQNHSACATATYGPVDASTGHVKVFNWERVSVINGPIRNITGYAYQTDANNYPGRLDVVLDSTNVLPFPAPYWVYDSSKTLDQRDSWMIVSDMFKLTLFILCRDIAAFPEQQVLSLAASRGFTGLDAPVKIIQGPACNYNRPY